MLVEINKGEVYILVSTEEGPNPKTYFGLSYLLFISTSMSNRLYFFILTMRLYVCLYVLNMSF